MYLNKLYAAIRQVHNPMSYGIKQRQANEFYFKAMMKIAEKNVSVGTIGHVS